MRYPEMIILTEKFLLKRDNNVSKKQLDYFQEKSKEKAFQIYQETMYHQFYDSIIQLYLFL